ncbi:unnamed protein product, partial [Prorocentrum cordatum]
DGIQADKEKIIECRSLCERAADYKVGISSRPKKANGGWEVHIQCRGAQKWSKLSSSMDPIGDGSLEAAVVHANGMAKKMHEASEHDHDHEAVGDTQVERDEEVPDADMAKILDGGGSLEAEMAKILENEGCDGDNGSQKTTDAGETVVGDDIEVENNLDKPEKRRRMTEPLDDAQGDGHFGA